MMIYTILVFCGLIALSHCKRYDVEAEGKKLYGINENFNSLLHGFRRTPEYKSVLQVEVDEMMQHYMETAAIYFKKHLEVAQLDALNIFGIVTTTPAPVQNLRDGKRTIHKEPGKKVTYKFKPNRRAIDFEELKPDLNVSDTEFLKKYVHFAQQLSPAQNNKLKDIAFKNFGHSVHDIIHAMKNDVAVVSTKQPFGSKEAKDDATGGVVENHPEDHGTTTQSTKHESTLNIF